MLLDLSFAYDELPSSTCAYFLEQTSSGSILRSKLCNGAALSFENLPGICGNCANIPSRAFKQKAQRRANQPVMGAKTPNKQLDRSSAIAMKIQFVQKALKERTTSHFLRLQLARSRYQLMRIEDRMKADADRGDLRALVHRLQESQNSNESAMILDAARNLMVGAEGGDFSTSTGAFGKWSAFANGRPPSCITSSWQIFQDPSRERSRRGFKKNAGYRRSS